MSLRLTCITKSGVAFKNPHKSVVFYCWENEETGDKGKTPRQEMIEQVRGGEVVYIRGHDGYRQYCFVNKDEEGEEFLQTHSDNKPTDDLLSMIPWETQASA